MNNNYCKKSGTTSVICALVFLSIFFLNTCSKNGGSPGSYNPPPAVPAASADIALKWADITLYTIRFSAFNTPTYSSRSLGYMGLAMYESIVWGDSSKRSMDGQLNGLSLPQPETGNVYHWLLALNAAQDTLLKLLYPVPANSHRFIHDRIDSLYKALLAEQSDHIDPAIVSRSVDFGRLLALAIYNWSLTDGGDKGFTHNFDPSFPFPSGPSYWVPPTFGQTVSLYPLHPHWGNNRPFVKADAAIPVPPIIPFSTDTASDYYKIYKAVYEKNKILTDEEKHIAAWWSDDPTQTFSPPGHSYYLASLAAKTSNAPLIKAAEAFARTGMATADAFINCWKAKYVYFNERPSTYVKKYIDSTWVQYWPEPPFPAFPSGHSIQAAAMATVLTAVYGEPFAFVDKVFEGEARYPYYDLVFKPRSFNSFWEAANEIAYSRFLGGIHTQQDNDAGLKEGKIIGENVNALQWNK